MKLEQAINRFKYRGIQIKNDHENDLLKQFVLEAFPDGRFNHYTFSYNYYFMTYELDMLTCNDNGHRHLPVVDINDIVK